MPASVNGFVPQKIKLIQTKDNILYLNQITDIGNGYAVQDFEPAYDAYDAFAADDFTVPSGQTWNINYIMTVNSMSDTTDAAPISLVNVYFYADTGGMPADVIHSYKSIPCVYDEYVTYIPLPDTVTLQEGTYWICVQPRYNYEDGGVTYWYANNTNNGAQWVWKNPGDGFGTGATDWTVGTDVPNWQNAAHDLTLTLFFKETYTVTFTAQVNGNPVADVPIKVLNETKVSDENGQATFQLYSGHYIVNVSSPCYEDFSMSFDVQGDMDVDLPLNANDFNVSFIVINEASQPVTNATVLFNDQTLTTNNAGVAATTAPCGKYEFTILKEGYAMYKDSLTVDAQDVSKTIILTDVAASSAKITVFPNPVQNTLYINLNANTEKIQLFDISGKLVYEISNPANKTEIDMHNLEQGVYLLKLWQNNSLNVIKVIKQ